MLNDRRKLVLQALIQEYIASATPVGSRTLVDRYHLEYSPATVRNELSILEETGFLVQPHISAGRIPTDIAYRSFVDELLDSYDETVDESIRNEIRIEAEELQELVEQASHALTKLTDSLAVVMTPGAASAAVKKVSVVSMAPDVLLFVVVTEDGRVIDRHAHMDMLVDQEQIASLEVQLNAICRNKRVAQIRKFVPVLEAGRHNRDLEDLFGEAEWIEFEGASPILSSTQRTAQSILIKKSLEQVALCLEEDGAERLNHVGVPALLGQPEFKDSEQAAAILRRIEDQLAVLEELRGALSAEDITVQIGHENKHKEFDHISIVAAPYGKDDADGFVAVLGPTRMDYRRAISAVKAVAETITEELQ